MNNNYSNKNPSECKYVLTSEKLSFNTDETCELLSINRNLLDCYRRKGIIKSIKCGRNNIYPRYELENFLNKYNGREITKDGIVV